VVDLGERPWGARVPYFGYKKIAEGRKAGRASKKKNAPPSPLLPALVQGLDLPLTAALFCVSYVLLVN